MSDNIKKIIKEITEITEDKSKSFEIIEKHTSKALRNIYDYLLQNNKLNQTDLKDAIISEIASGTSKGLEIENLFPEFIGYNPYYSFRKFKVDLNIVKPIKDVHIGGKSLTLLN